MPRPSINDADSATNNRFVNKLFKPGVNFQFINTKQPESRIAILPAIPDPVGDDGYRLDDFLPYRDENGNFTRWAERHYCVSRFGPDQNHTICSPLTFDTSAYCPLTALRKTAASYPDLCELAGLGPDGKKHPTDREFFKRAIVTAVDEMVAFNVIMLDGERANEPTVLQTKKTVLGSVATSKDRSSWGLIGMLQRRLPERFIDPNAAWDEFDKQYEVGDITHPDALAPIRIFRQEQTKGGIAMYNAALVTDPQGRAVPTIRATDEMLLGRRYLPDIFVELEKPELFDLIFELFRDYPKLLRLAYSAKIPNIESRLQSEGIVQRADTVRQVGGRRDVASVSAAAGDDAPDPVPDEMDMTPRRSATTARTAAAPVATPAASREPVRARAAGNPSPAATTTKEAAAPITKPDAFTPRRPGGATTRPAGASATGATSAPVADFNPNHPRDGAAGEGAVVDVMRMMEEEEAAAANG